jgi:hypothetical protein
MQLGVSIHPVATGQPPPHEAFHNARLGPRQQQGHENGETSHILSIRTLNQVAGHLLLVKRYDLAHILVLYYCNL